MDPEDVDDEFDGPCEFCGGIDPHHKMGCANDLDGRFISPEEDEEDRAKEAERMETGMKIYSEKVMFRDMQARMTALEKGGAIVVSVFPIQLMPGVLGCMYTVDVVVVYRAPAQAEIETDTEEAKEDKEEVDA